MAIGTITVGSQGNKSASTPLRAVSMSFPGDGTYATGGTADFEGSVQAQLNGAVTLITVISGDCGGYVPVYDRTNDKLKVYESDIDSDQPLKEVDNAADLSGTTFNVVALCK